MIMIIIINVKDRGKSCFEDAGVKITDRKVK